jgi:medium-chain acyl-[acyl-carrier-protein] hydrolase
LDTKTPWLPYRPTTTPPRLRLFCFPHAGGGAADYHSWKKSLPADVEIRPVLLPGRETRSSEDRYTELDPLVDAIVEELHPLLDLPYAVFGHSMGTLLAFECVRRLQQAGTPAPLWLFLSGRRAPDSPPDGHPLHTLPDAEFIEQLNRIYKGIPEEFLDNPEIMEFILPNLRADVAVVESYCYREQEPLDCPLTVFAGEADASVNWQQLFAWKRQTRRQFAAQFFPGGHFYPRAPLLQSIATTLTKLSA